jgi:hypothetical protein
MKFIAQSSAYVLELHGQVARLQVIRQVEDRVCVSLTPLNRGKLPGTWSSDPVDVAGNVDIADGANAANISDGTDVEDNAVTMIDADIPEGTDVVSIPADTSLQVELWIDMGDRLGQTEKVQTTGMKEPGWTYHFADNIFLIGLVTYLMWVTALGVLTIASMRRTKNLWKVRDLAYNNEMLLILGSAAVSSAIATVKLLNRLLCQERAPCILGSRLLTVLELARSAMLNRLDATYASWSNAIGYSIASVAMMAAFVGSFLTHKSSGSPSEIHGKGLHTSWPLGIVGLVSSFSLEAGLIKFFELGITDGQMYIDNANVLFALISSVIAISVLFQAALGISIVVLQRQRRATCPSQDLEN